MAKNHKWSINSMTGTGLEFTFTSLVFNTSALDKMAAVIQSSDRIGKSDFMLRLLKASN